MDTCKCICKQLIHMKRQAGTGGHVVYAPYEKTDIIKCSFNRLLMTIAAHLFHGGAICCCCRNFPPFYTGAYMYIYSIEYPKPGVLDRTRGPHTAHYVQLRHFIYFSPSSASTEGEYGLLEPKFHDGGHCHSVLRSQCVILLPPSISG